MATSKTVEDIQDGDYAVLGDQPCQVFEIDNEGGNSYKVSGESVLDGQEYSATYSANESVLVPAVQYEDCEVESADDVNNVVYLVDGSQVLGRSQTVAQLLYQEISAREDRGDTSKVSTSVVTAMGRRAAVWG